MWLNLGQVILVLLSLKGHFFVSAIPTKKSKVKWLIHSNLFSIHWIEIIQLSTNNGSLFHHEMLIFFVRLKNAQQFWILWMMQ